VVFWGWGKAKRVKKKRDNLKKHPSQPFPLLPSRVESNRKAGRVFLLRGFLFLYIIRPILKQGEPITRYHGCVLPIVGNFASGSMHY
jgi:hypothetical protein